MKKLAWRLARSTCLTGVSLFLSSPTSSQSTCSKWHSCLSPWKPFLSENHVCVFINLQVTQRSLFKHWPFQSRFLFQSRWLWEGTQQGSFYQHWSKGEEDPGLPLVGLIEGRATRCLSRKGDWLPAPVPVPPRFS